MFHNHENKWCSATTQKHTIDAFNKKNNNKKNQNALNFFYVFAIHQIYLLYLVFSIISSWLATWKKALCVFTLSTVTLVAVRKTLVLKGQRAVSPSPSPLLWIDDALSVQERFGRNARALCWLILSIKMKTKKWGPWWFTRWVILTFWGSEKMHPTFLMV